ncbi:MAG: GNAT family N-acetyltransferase [Paracoccaceae bacterium]
MNAALRRLSQDMGDTHLARDDQIEKAGFGAVPVFYALLAEHDGAMVGAAVYSPLFSTTRGMAGSYVSDLWVDTDLRGRQLGARLLAAVQKDAQDRWDSGFIRLAVYHANRRAMKFYERLGFAAAAGEATMTLESDSLTNLEKYL